MSLDSPQKDRAVGLIRHYLSQQETMPYPTTTLPDASPPSTVLPDQTLADQPTLELPATTPGQSQKIVRAVIAVASIALVCTLYLIWRAPTTASPGSPPQAASTGAVSITTSTTIGGPVSAKTAVDSTSGTGGTIQVYIVGAVEHPGVYTLPNGARVYQLLQAAGGPIAGANLKALNLAAKLSDGEEVYVALVGETPPSSNGNPTETSTAVSTGATGGTNGQLININTANATALRQSLHTSSSVAQAIVTYRTQHGAYTSVDQLAQVVSRTVYNRIKSEVTV